MPSHRMNSGTQAMDGIARSACNVGSSSRRASDRIAGRCAETAPAIRRGVAATTPMRKAGADDGARPWSRGWLQLAAGGRAPKVCQMTAWRRHQATSGTAKPDRQFPQRAESRERRSSQWPSAAMQPQATSRIASRDADCKTRRPFARVMSAAEHAQMPGYNARPAAPGRSRGTCLAPSSVILANEVASANSSAAEPDRRSAHRRVAFTSTLAG